MNFCYRTLAQHHHFESISEAITQGSDIIPKIHAMCAFDPPRRVADTEEGESLRHEIAALEMLLQAYEENALPERMPGARELLRA
jgi:fructose-1,6-bisphosphatase III